MLPSPEFNQRIARLTPWPEALAALDGLAAPVCPRETIVSAAADCIAACDVRIQAALPGYATARRDGWAVRADLVADAGPYAPVPLLPRPRWVESGDALPVGCDAVLPADAVAISDAGCEAVAAVAPGEGVAAAGYDATPDAPLLRAGRLIGTVAVTALRAAGIETVQVRRPRVGILAWSTPETGNDALTPMLEAALARAGGESRRIPAGTGLEAAIVDAALDALVTLGGTGEGRRDRAATSVAAAGQLLLHGVGIRPGETAGVGVVAGRPVLLLPGRLDGAVASWLLLGVPLLRRLTGALFVEIAASRRLTRKMTSAIGLAEAVLVEDDGDGVRPIAAGAFPLAALAQASGWVLVPPESEGYSSGATVAVRPLP